MIFDYHKANTDTHEMYLCSWKKYKPEVSHYSYYYIVIIIRIKANREANKLLAPVIITEKKTK